MEADDQDTDSTFDERSLASSSTSLNSEFTRFQHENNRRYHAYRAGHYLFPNDEGELDRMDLEHHNQGLMLGALHLAPLNTPNEILELGTGSGIWAIDMADQYPSASVLGIDLSPVQPDWVPPNLKFEVDDFESEWTFGSDRFDLIYARQLLCSVSDYPLLYRRIFDATKPGGWFEISEIEVGVFSDDGTVPEDSASCQWARLLGEATQKLGRSIPPVTQYKKFMEDAGFVDVQELYLKRPTNDWPKDRRLKEIGRFACANYLIGLEGFTLRPFTRVLGWSVEEVQVLMAKIRSEWKNRAMHGYHKGIVAWGRKPLGQSRKEDGSL